jgi:hypothetical protein
VEQKPIIQLRPPKVLSPKGQIFHAAIMNFWANRPHEFKNLGEATIGYARAIQESTRRCYTQKKTPKQNR